MICETLTMKCRFTELLLLMILSIVQFASEDCFRLGIGELIRLGVTLVTVKCETLTMKCMFTELLPLMTLSIV